MANVTRVKGKRFTLTEIPSWVSGNTSTGNAVDFMGEDEKTALLINNTGSAGTITIKAGEHRGAIQGSEDIVIDAPAGLSFVTIDSGEFKQMTGVNKGKIIVVSSASTISIACIELDTAPVVEEIVHGATEYVHA